MVTSNPIDPFHWARKISRRDIQRLYESDARGMLDEELLEQVSAGITMRVLDMFEVMRAQQTGVVHCRDCGEQLPEPFRMGTRAKKLSLSCAKCGWQVTCGEFYDSYTGERMLPGSVPEVFEAYLARRAAARTPQEKLLLIDWLIHEFHENLGIPGRPVGENVIQGSKEQVAELIRSLAAGPHSTPGLAEKRAWLKKFNHPVRQFGHRHSSAEITAIARRLRVRTTGNKNQVVMAILAREPGLAPREDEQ